MGIKILAICFLCLTLCFNLLGQDSLRFDVLRTKLAFKGDAEVSPLESYYAGDTILVKKGGYIVLISNYLHAIDVQQDSLLVLPKFETYKMNGFYYPGSLSYLFQTAAKSSNLMGSVSAALTGVRIIFPPQGRLYLSSLQSVCFCWVSLTASEEKVIQVKSIYDDELIRLTTKDSVWQLNMQMIEPLLTDGLEEAVLDIAGERWLILPNTAQAVLPIDGCETESALNMLRLAMFFEHREGTGSELALRYFQRAADQKDDKVYKEILDVYLERRGAKD